MKKHSELASYIDVEALNKAAENTFIGEMGIVCSKLKPGSAEVTCEIRPRHLGSNGYLHGGAVSAILDTACGWGARASLPEGASGFVTMEFKTSFLGTARSGEVRAVAKAHHLGRQTQSWTAELLASGQSKPIALFSCTQLNLR